MTTPYRWTVDRDTLADATNNWLDYLTREVERGNRLSCPGYSRRYLALAELTERMAEHLEHGGSIRETWSSTGDATTVQLEGALHSRCVTRNARGEIVGSRLTPWDAAAHLANRRNAGWTRIHSTQKEEHQ